MTGVIAVLAFIWGMFVAIFWMCVGWRAMRAHERMADDMHSMRFNLRVSVHQADERPGGG